MSHNDAATPAEKSGFSDSGDDEVLSIGDPLSDTRDSAVITPFRGRLSHSCGFNPKHCAEDSPVVPNLEMSNNDAVTPAEKSELDDYGDDELLSIGEPSSDTQCSTSESGMSNTFLDEVLLEQYDGWTDEHDCWLGRWVRDDRMKQLLYSLQAFQFLDLQGFLSDSGSSFKPEIFAKGTELLDEFLHKAELDIVKADKRFPEGAYHFIDDIKWTKTIQDLYIALKYIQGADADLILFYNLWIDAIVPAITKNLPESISRDQFEILQKLTWTLPKLESSTSCSLEPDLDDASCQFPIAGLSDLKFEEFDPETISTAPVDSIRATPEI